MRNKVISIMLIVLDVIMLLLFVFVLTGFLRYAVGADIIEYENSQVEKELKEFIQFVALLFRNLCLYLLRLFL